MNIAAFLACRRVGALQQPPAGTEAAEEAALRWLAAPAVQARRTTT